MVWSHTWPSQPPAPSAALMKSAEAVDTVGLAELIRSVSLPDGRAARRFNQRHVGITGIDLADGTRAQRLRFQRDHARTEPAKTADAVADVGADVESKVARPDEAGVERIHRRIARRIAVVHNQRTPQRCERRVGAQLGECGVDSRHRVAITCEAAYRYRLVRRLMRCTQNGAQVRRAVAWIPASAGMTLLQGGHLTIGVIPAKAGT